MPNRAGRPHEASARFKMRTFKSPPTSVPAVSDAPVDWVSFLNREAQELGALNVIPKDVLRGHLRDRLKEAYQFPLRLDLRCLVVGERHLEAPQSASASAGSASLSVARQSRHLELVPEGLTRDAAALTGPLLVATDRPLQEGSVVRVQIELPEPTASDAGGPALLARLVDMRVDVAVEP